GRPPRHHEADRDWHRRDGPQAGRTGRRSLTTRRAGDGGIDDTAQPGSRRRRPRSGRALRHRCHRIWPAGARVAHQARGARTGGEERNREYLETLVDWGTAAEPDRALLVDPQTSGGLLLTMSPS